VFEALGMTSNSVGEIHHTMMSSITPPRSLHRCVYWARPGSIFGQIVGEGALQFLEGTVTNAPYGAQVGDVKDHAVIATGEVFGDSSRAVTERHGPAPKGNDLGPQRHVRVVRDQGRRSSLISHLP
jgi:hypothetical protein